MAPDTVPTATDTSDGTSVLYYRDADHVAICTVQAGKNGSRAPSASASVVGTRCLRVTPSGPTGSSTGAARAVTDPRRPGAFLLSDDVARLVLHLDGQDFEARVGPNFAVVWLPAGSRPNDVALDATVTAYAADGTELDYGGLLDRPAPF